MSQIFTEINKNTLFVSVMDRASPRALRGLVLEGISLPPDTLWAACSWVQNDDVANGILITAQGTGQFQCFEFNETFESLYHRQLKISTLFSR